MTSDRRDELLIAACVGVTTIAAIALAAVYWLGGQPQAEGVLLALSFGGLAAGLITFSHRLLPTAEVEEARHELDSPDVIDDDLAADLARGQLSRRRLLVGALGSAIGALTVAALFPIRSLGPRPRGALSHTPWRRGVRVITIDGRPVRAEDVPTQGLLTVFPDGHAGRADAQVVVVRVNPDRLRPRRERADWAPDGILAFSKVCTHAGCPVGLYAAERHELLCPCHQSAFDVLDHARPVAGPAAAELPQLPLGIVDGELVAEGSLSAPVGPAYWHHT